MSDEATVRVDPLTDFFVSTEERDQIAEHARDTSSAIAAHEDDRELMAFWLDTEQYAVEIAEIQEIIKVPEITAVPRLGEVVIGIISLRGVIVPLVDLRRALRLNEDELGRGARILVLRAGGDPIGLLVDRVTSVIRIPSDDIEPTPATLQRDVSEMLEGVGRIADELIIILDIGAVIRLLERSVLDPAGMESST